MVISVAMKLLRDDGYRTNLNIPPRISYRLGIVTRFTSLVSVNVSGGGLGWEKCCFFLNKLSSFENVYLSLHMDAEQFVSILVKVTTLAKIEFEWKKKTTLNIPQQPRNLFWHGASAISKNWASIKHWNSLIQYNYAKNFQIRHGCQCLHVVCLVNNCFKKFPDFV